MKSVSKKDIIAFISSFPGGLVAVFVASFILGFIVFSISGENPDDYEWIGPWGAVAFIISVAGPVAWAVFRKK
ncbi:hypothetical protein [uncultured Sphaerochaeta sp.]|uniref:hypothetical protein n=1 Tax=uncultured Sphaerochaeta sp. TaxID=886478 RepID=UPI0026118B71|nr:hypothetical protein [uncultured Sphaerochaeta sp.]